jgi:hypothetical protein
MRSVCAEARRDRRPPEKLLVEVKSALRSLPELECVPRGPEREALVARVVTILIDEYYASTGDKRA